jgi:hypothetical protein
LLLAVAVAVRATRVLVVVAQAATARLLEHLVVAHLRKPQSLAPSQLTTRSRLGLVEMAVPTTLS